MKEMAKNRIGFGKTIDFWNWKCLHVYKCLNLTLFFPFVRTDFVAFILYYIYYIYDLNAFWVKGFYCKVLQLKNKHFKA